MPRTAEVSVSAHLKKMSPDVRPIVEAARGMVKAIAPKANEIPYRSRPPREASAMWKIARYAIEGANVVGVGTFPKHSTLFFYRGRELDDGTGVAPGERKGHAFHHVANTGRRRSAGGEEAGAKGVQAWRCPDDGSLSFHFG